MLHVSITPTVTSRSLACARARDMVHTTLYFCNALKHCNNDTILCTSFEIWCCHPWQLRAVEKCLCSCDTGSRPVSAISIFRRKYVVVENFFQFRYFAITAAKLMLVSLVCRASANDYKTILVLAKSFAEISHAMAVETIPSTQAPATIHTSIHTTIHTSMHTTRCRIF